MAQKLTKVAETTTLANTDTLIVVDESAQNTDGSTGALKRIPKSSTGFAFPSDITSAINTEVSNRNTAITNAINTEATNRNTAISNAIDTEVTNRNNAIDEAVSTKADAIVKTTSGEIASFSDGGDELPMKSLKVNIVPKQSGSGDPSPSNVRPISGWSGVNVNRAGKNLFKVEAIYPTDSNVTVDGSSIIINGTFSSQTTFQIECRTPQGVTQIPEGVQLIQTNTKNASMLLVKKAGGQSRWISANTPFTIRATEKAGYFYVSFPAGTYNNEKFDFQIELGSTATDFEPYQGNTYPISLGQTVYGGTLEVMSGKLVIDRGYAEFDGSSDEGWSKWDGAFVFQGALTNIKKLNTVSTTDLVVIADRFVSMGVNYRNYVIGKNAVVKVSGNNSYIAVDPTDYADVNAFKTSLASDPMQIVYELATPTEITLTPTQVTTLLGQNNIWADSGSVEVEYRADTTLAYNELLSLIASLS